MRDQYGVRDRGAKYRSMGYQQYNARFEVKSVQDDGSFDGYASVFTKDEDNDVIVKGAFQRTIKNKGGKVPILYHHDKTRPIGLNREMFEDQYGLHVKGQLNLELELARDTRALVKQGAIKGLSIGFFITQPPELKDGVRYIKEVNLMEYSFVTFPANEDAQVGYMKGGHTVIEKGKSTDYNSVLDQQKQEDDLWNERYLLQNALSTTVHNIIHGDGDNEGIADHDEAVKAIGEAYHAHADAMTDWHGRSIDNMRSLDDNNKKEQKGDKPSVVLDTAKVQAKMQAIVDTHAIAQNHMERSKASSSRALDMTRQLVYAHLYHLDQYAANPAGGKGKSDNPPPLCQAEHLPNQKEADELLGAFELIKFK